MRNKIVTLTTNDLTSGTVSAIVAGSSNSGDTTAVQSGTYSNQEYSCIYTISIPNPTHYQVDADFGVDRSDSLSGAIAFGSPLNVGTAGVKVTFTDVAGGGVVTVGDTWTINCAGQKKIVDCKMNITTNPLDGNTAKAQTISHFPRRLKMINGSGKELSFNIISNDTELEEFLADNTNYALIPVANSATLNYTDIYPLPTPEYFVVQKTESGNPTASVEIEMLTYYPRVSR